MRCVWVGSWSSSMRPWGSFSRHCEACLTNGSRRMVARRHASARSKVEVAREEHAENVRWSKQPEARSVLEQPRFDVDGATADAGALDSLEAYLQARQWHHPRGPARRFLSHLLTYPLTLASGVREAGLGRIPVPMAPSARKGRAASRAAHDSEGNNTGLRSRSSSDSDSTDSDSTDGDSGRALAVVCLGARAESTMPPSFWLETLFALPGVSRLSLHLIGPELGVPPGVVAAGQGGGGQATAAGRDGGHTSEGSACLSLTATHATVLSVGGRTLEVGWTRAMLGRAGPTAAGEAEQKAADSSATAAAAAAAAATEAAEKAVEDAEAFVLFNPGLGHPHLRKGWAGALERLLDTGKPIIVSCHSEEDLERDASLLREAGAVCCCPDHVIASAGTADGAFLPRKNAFRSLMVSEDPLSTPGQEELVSCNWGIIVVRGGGEGVGGGGSL